jgi:hypothetical protein
VGVCSRRTSFEKGIVITEVKGREFVGTASVFGVGCVDGAPDRMEQN